MLTPDKVNSGDRIYLYNSEENLLTEFVFDQFITEPFPAVACHIGPMEFYLLPENLYTFDELEFDDKTTT
jgi:hypothetical protein